MGHMSQRVSALEVRLTLTDRAVDLNINTTIREQLSIVLRRINIIENYIKRLRLVLSSEVKVMFKTSQLKLFHSIGASQILEDFIEEERRRKKKIIFYYIIQQYKIGPRDSTAPTETQTGSRTLHNGPQYKTGATKE